MLELIKKTGTFVYREELAQLDPEQAQHYIAELSCDGLVRVASVAERLSNRALVDSLAQIAFNRTLDSHSLDSAQAYSAIEDMHSKLLGI